MRYPTATAAAAAETCKNERRERQAGFSAMVMVLLTSNKPLALRAAAAHKLSRSAPRELPICIHFLARVDLQGAAPCCDVAGKIRRRKREWENGCRTLKPIKIFVFKQLQEFSRRL
jgi:hypothetical protein